MDRILCDFGMQQKECMRSTRATVFPAEQTETLLDLVVKNRQTAARSIIPPLVYGSPASCVVS